MTYAFDPQFLVTTADSSPTTVLPTIGMTEKRVITFDFSADLQSGEALSGTPTVAVTVSAGADGTPANILNGAVELNTGDTQAQQPVTGAGAAQAGNTYLIEVTATTGNGLKTLVRRGLLTVEA